MQQKKTLRFFCYSTLNLFVKLILCLNGVFKIIYFNFKYYFAIVLYKLFQTIFLFVITSYYILKLIYKVYLNHCTPKWKMNKIL